MRNLKLTIQYDGSRYKGFQKLKDDERTIQGKIESVLGKMTNEPIEIIGSGRTDMGVHAIGQVVNFKTTTEMSVEKINRYLYEYLPEDIVVKNIEEVEERFHSRYNAKSKICLYKIDNNKYHDAFSRKYAAHIPKQLDVDLMKEACKYIIGKHDFTSFASSKSKKKANVREIYDMSIRNEKGIIEIYVEGDGFLYNMVRIIAGVLIDVGNKSIKPEDIEDIINAKDRSKASDTAPAKGLFLYKVFY